MPVNTFYKQHYTEEEVEECFQWFEQREGQLPPSLSIPSMEIPDLPATAKRMVIKLRQQMKDNGVYSGMFSLLELIRSHLQKDYQL